MKASKFLDANGIEPAETVLASKKLGRADAISLSTAASTVIVAKGKSVRSFKPDGKASKEIVDAMLGPTGNLRAPTLRVGRTIVVGFDEATYDSVLL